MYRALLRQKPWLWTQAGKEGGGAGRGGGGGPTLRRAAGQGSSTVNGERWLTAPLDRRDPSQLPSGLRGGLISSP